MSDDREDGWTGWCFWKGEWTRCCEGATQVGAARRLEARRRLLRLAPSHVRLRPAGEGPPLGGVSRPKRRFEMPATYTPNCPTVPGEDWREWRPEWFRG
jgi:hypothetical protein